jgi:hypothetical protein
MRGRRAVRRHRRGRGLAGVAVAILVGGAAGLGGMQYLNAQHVMPWTVHVILPAGERADLPAVNGAGAVIAAFSAVMIALVWYAASAARQRRLWRENGGTVITGDLAGRAAVNAETAGRDRERLTAAERDIEGLHASVGRIRDGLTAVGEGLLQACENAGQPVPLLPDLDEPPTAPVLRLIRGDLDGQAG